MRDAEDRLNTITQELNEINELFCQDPEAKWASCRQVLKQIEEAQMILATIKKFVEKVCGKKSRTIVKIEFNGGDRVCYHMSDGEMLDMPMEAKDMHWKKILDEDVEEYIEEASSER